VFAQMASWPARVGGRAPPPVVRLLTRATESEQSCCRPRDGELRQGAQASLSRRDHGAGVPPAELRRELDAAAATRRRRVAALTEARRACADPAVVGRRCGRCGSPAASIASRPATPAHPDELAHHEPDSSCCSDSVARVAGRTNRAALARRPAPATDASAEHGVYSPTVSDASAAGGGAPAATPSRRRSGAGAARRRGRRRRSRSRRASSRIASASSAALVVRAAWRGAPRTWTRCARAPHGANGSVVHSERLFASSADDRALVIVRKWCRPAGRLRREAAAAYGSRSSSPRCAGYHSSSPGAG